MVSRAQRKRDFLYQTLSVPRIKKLCVVLTYAEAARKAYEMPRAIRHKWIGSSGFDKKAAVVQFIAS
jgi:hypothetical protein